MDRKPMMFFFVNMISEIAKRVKLLAPIESRYNSDPWKRKRGGSSPGKKLKRGTKPMRYPIAQAHHPVQPVRSLNYGGRRLR